MRISYWSSEVCSSDLPIEAKLCGTVAIADLDAVATMQLHEREAVFIGGVVADEHRHPITEQRPRHQGFDRPPLVQPARARFHHHLAAQHTETVRAGPPPHQILHLSGTPRPPTQ